MQLSERPKKQLKFLSLTYSCVRGWRNSWRSYLWHGAIWEAEERVEVLIFDIQLHERPKKQLKIFDMQLYEKPKKQLKIFDMQLYERPKKQLKIFNMQLYERPKKQLKFLSLTYSCMRGRRNSWRSYLWHTAVWGAEETVEDLIFDIQLYERPKKQLKSSSLRRTASICIPRNQCRNANTPTEDAIRTFFALFSYSLTSNVIFFKRLFFFSFIFQGILRIWKGKTDTRG